MASTRFFSFSSLDHSDTTSTSNSEQIPSQDAMFRAWIKTSYDALLVFEAARQGLVPRVTRRFHDAEKRSMIVSGAVLVFTEEESGIKRWTDPFVWSASRMLGNFMIYREREDAMAAPASPYCRSVMNVSAGEASRIQDSDLERCIYGSWNRGKGLKTHGLMKKTISFPIDGVVYHLVSYYSASDVLSGKLQTPSTLESLASLVLSKEVLRNISQFRHPPRMDVDANGRATYIGEEESMTSLYTTRASLSPPMSRPDLPAPSMIRSSTPSSNSGIVQPIPGRAIQLSLDSDSRDLDAERPTRISSSVRSQNSRVQYLPNTSNFRPRVSRTHTTSQSCPSPYLRPNDSSKTVRSKQHRGVSVSEAKQCYPHPGTSIISQRDNAYHYSPGPSSTSLLNYTSQTWSHYYDPNLFSLPHLLGGSPTFGTFYPGTSSEPENGYVSAASTTGLWDAIGGSADWVYQGQSHELPHAWSRYK